MRQVKIALVEGDGSAPRMMAQATKVAVKAAKKDGIEIVFVPTPMGWAAYRQYGDTFPPESFKKATELGLLFFGGVGNPEYDKTLGKEHPEMMPETRCLLSLRSRWQLLLNFRPMIFYKELAHLCGVRPEQIPDKGIQQIWIRFLLQDSYYGTRDLSQYIPEDVRVMLGIKPKEEVTGEEKIVTELAYYTREMLEKYFRAVFNYARATKLPLISVHKKNVMGRYVFWTKICEKISKEFPDVPVRDQLVDSANELLFRPAMLHGVIAIGNEHGDLLSDGAAKALGSIGMMCSSAINPDTGQAMFESGAGTAPTCKEPNPIGRILTTALMLRHVGAPKGAEAIEKSVNATLQEGYRTPDIASDSDDSRKLLTTEEMGEMVLSKL